MFNELKDLETHPFTLSMLKSIKNGQQDTGYAYTPIMNINMMSDTGIDMTNMSNKVLIFDKQTLYFNLSAFISAFGENPNKQIASRYTRLNQYIEHRNRIEDEDLQHLSDDVRQRYENSRAYDKSKHVIKSWFIEKRTSFTPNISGTYVHPELLMEALFWCNRRIALKCTQIMTSILIIMGNNESKSPKLMLNCNKQIIKSNVKERTEYIKNLMKNKEISDNSKFYKPVIEDRLILDSTVYYQHNKKKSKRVKDLEQYVNKSIAIVRYFDEDEFLYDDNTGPMLFSIHVIRSKDEQNFLQKYTKITVDKLGKISHISNAYIIVRNLLSTIPYNDENIVDNFIKLYADELYIQTKDNKVIIENYQKFINFLIDFSQDYIVNF